MEAAFDDHRADFSGMHGGSDELHVSAVLHKAFVDVNEAGTEAAAATAVVVATRGGEPNYPPAVFRADRPFLFLIRENRTKSILFVGRVTNPKAA
jgi:serpin B